MTEGFCQRYLELVNLSCIGKADIVEEWKLDRYQALMRTRRTSGRDRQRLQVSLDPALRDEKAA